MFYISREARSLLTTLVGHDYGVCNLYTRGYVDQAVLMFSPKTIEQMIFQGDDIQMIVDKKPALADCPSTRIVNCYQNYELIVDEYVTHDYTRVDLLKLVALIGQYDYSTISKAIKTCKSLKHFNIPYLAAVLDNEGSEYIDQQRRENKLTEKVIATQPLTLPVASPIVLGKRMDELNAEKRIDDALRGTRR